MPSSLDNKVLISLIISGAVTFLTYMVPFLNVVAYPFMLLSTLVHEMGHGVAAIIVGGKFQSFLMWSDGSGVAKINGEFGNFAKAFVAFGGLVGPAIMASLFFISAKNLYRAQVSLALFGFILLLALILVVRNAFGLIFVGAISVSCLYSFFSSLKKYAQIVVSFLAIQLSLSVFSRSDYLFMKNAVTNQGVMPSDVEQMSQALWLPYWFFGGICALFSLMVLVLGVKSLLKNK